MRDFANFVKGLAAVTLNERFYETKGKENLYGLKIRVLP